MAVNEEEQKLREETRTALLKAIKKGAETVENMGHPGGEELEHLANAYATVVATAKKPGAVYSR